MAYKKGDPNGGFAYASMVIKGKDWLETKFNEIHEIITNSTRRNHFYGILTYGGINSYGLRLWV